MKPDPEPRCGASAPTSFQNARVRAADELTARERAAAFQRWKEQSLRTPWNKLYRVVSADAQTLRLELLDRAAPQPVDIPARLVPRELCVVGAVLEFSRSDDGVVTLARGADTSR
jgi:hypothetical protein